MMSKINKITYLPQMKKSPRRAKADARLFTIVANVKLLIKAPVLLANILPVFSGFWLALYFTNASLYEYISLGLLVIAGSTLVMAGALVLNNWYDTDIDSVMERTQDRPTVTGSIPLKVVLIIGISFTLIGFSLLMFTTIEVVVYALIGWFTYVVLYTVWSKRRYTINTFIGSVSGAVTPLIGWSAIDSSIHVVPILLFLTLLIWQMPHTYAVAMRKKEEYELANVAMLPVVRGFKVTKWYMFFYVVCLLPIPFVLPLNLVFIVISTLLNVLWVGISIYGLFTTDDKKYAKISFIYSVYYLTIFFTLLIAVTFFDFSL